MSRQLLTSTSVVACMTFLSRLLGLARDIIIAHVFGAEGATDAFWVAFKIPNFMRRLFAEGAFSQAFVPVLADYREQSTEAELKIFIAGLLGVFSSVLLLLVMLGFLCAPLIVSLFAPGFLAYPERFHLTVKMLRLTFPYIFFISLTALYAGILNTYSRFALPALTPVLLNLALIAAAIFGVAYFHFPVMALAVGVLVAGVLQMLFQGCAVGALGLWVWPRWGWRHSGVRRVLTLMLPAILGVSVVQIGILLDTIFASFLPQGSISWLYYSERLMGFPLGIFGVAIATVILPQLAKQKSRQAKQDYEKTLDWGLRCILLIALPSALGLLFLSGPLLATLFQSGRFDAQDVLMASKSLKAYALGLPAFMLIKVLAAGFYGQQNIKTPVKIAAFAVFTNVIFNALLIVPLAHAGLALATGIAACVNALLLVTTLCRKGYYTPQPGWLLFSVRLVLATIALAVFLIFACKPMAAWLQGAWYVHLGHLLLLVGMGVLLYLMVLWLSGLRWRHLKL